MRAYSDSGNPVDQRVLDFPLEPGKRWTTFEPAPGGGGRTTACEVRGRERVRVPAGTFDCARIESQMDQLFPSLSPLRHELVHYRLSP